MNKEIHEHKPNRQRAPERQGPYDTVVFDVDSTLVTIEGLDWLAKHKGCEREVVELTKRSMDGLMDFHDAMTEKMRILAPNHEDFVRLGLEYCRSLVPGAAETVARLKKLDKEVWLMSGNYAPAVTILADRLGIDPAHVLCNRVFFDAANGDYLGFDAENPLAKNGGKAAKIREVLQGKRKRIVFVGDSATDLDVQNHVSLFVGFGGVVTRDIVKQHADRFIGERNLLPVLDIVAEAQRHKLPEKKARDTRPAISFSGLGWKRLGGIYM